MVATVAEAALNEMTKQYSMRTEYYAEHIDTNMNWTRQDNTTQHKTRQYKRINGMQANCTLNTIESRIIKASSHTGNIHTKVHRASHHLSIYASFYLHAHTIGIQL